MVPFLPELAAHLDLAGDGPLYSWTHEGYRNWQSKTFKRAVRKLGPEWSAFRPYDLRHTFGSRLLAERRNPIEVASIMGNSPQILLSTYAHFIAELG